MSWLKHRHKLEVTTLQYGYDGPSSPITVINWQCRRCSHTHVTDLDGRWVLKPGRGKPTLVPDDAGRVA